MDRTINPRILDNRAMTCRAVKRRNPGVVAPARMTRYYATAKLDPDSMNRDIARINEAILDQLRLVGADISLSLEIHADNASGFDECVVQIIEGNVANLKLDNSGFEES
ncbi:hypothetical protein [Bifidobacterium gallicum]|uniref:ATPase AAA n=1 Tax=Bifidobacterium gallicum DSM 20093 = LMG 11596 TaxID=561180 RepID=D1NUL9_9BIFI|nr:hypothetical protein [Bifidobacterium gallicum]EFA22520.1 hypothetical protein BIFGAL_03544 [Bifidobacterium gallicum DSM 20093 = LMG 11596]KFI59514.1 ATPase AAA [Bifidobacterium gallicum DSM 20093 = LMG 11596]